MAHISKEELLKLARISQIAVIDDEIEGLLSSLQDVLSYAERVKEVAHIPLETKAYRNSNVMRKDIVEPTDPEPILALGPSVEEHFFVVPAIVQHPKL